jgi:broad specificity phosphatase PhoE
MPTFRSTTYFDHVLPCGESSRQAQYRILRVLDELRAKHETGTIVVASHGNLIALALHA